MKDDIQEALRNPSQVYASPAAVIQDSALGDHQKRQILENWEQEAIRLQSSEDEGMQGGEQSQLDAIKAALDSLG